MGTAADEDPNTQDSVLDQERTMTGNQDTVDEENNIHTIPRRVRQPPIRFGYHTPGSPAHYVANLSQYSTVETVQTQNPMASPK